MKQDFEQYSTKAPHYDETRTPAGLGLLLECLKRCKTPLGNQHILDAGCGTGNFIHAIHSQIGDITGIEMNEGMLQKCREKFTDIDGITLTQGSVTQMPFPSNHFHGIICNQVTHHLDDPQNQDFPQLKTMLKECHRVLKVGGGLAINTSSHPQIRDGFWWISLIPEATQRMVKQYAPLPLLKQILEETGFSSVTVQVDRDAVLQGDTYLDPKGPLDAAYRSGDSTWALVTPGELKLATEHIKQMDVADILDVYVQSRDMLRQEIGQTTTVFGQVLKKNNN